MLQLENPQGLILFGLRREVLEGSAIEPDEVLAAIDAVTAADVQRVAQEVIGSNALRLALIGPFEDSERFEKLLTVYARRINGRRRPASSPGLGPRVHRAIFGGRTRCSDGSA